MTTRKPAPRSKQKTLRPSAGGKAPAAARGQGAQPRELAATTTRRAPAVQTRRPRGVEDAGQIAMLASPTRLEIVMTLEALAQPSTVAELAAEMGRPADGLYYHLRALVGCGLLVEDARAGDRRYRSITPRGGRIRLRYRLGESGNARAVRRVAAGMLRLAERDFARASARAGTVVEGSQRELWVARLRGWVDAADLTEINRRLHELIEIMDRPRPSPSQPSRMLALTWLMAPLDPRPARRGAGRAKA